MTSLKPYLIRAIYDWIVDNGLTPYLLVNTDEGSVKVPTTFIQDNRIVLNLRPEAVQALSLGNDQISFNARFGGRPMAVVIPVQAVLALYAHENGRGMVFDEEESGDDAGPPTEPPPDSPGPSRRGKPHLKLVK